MHKSIFLFVCFLFVIIVAVNGPIIFDLFSQPTEARDAGQVLGVSEVYSEAREPELVQYDFLPAVAREPEPTPQIRNDAGEPAISSGRVIAIDTKSGTELYGRGEDEVSSIASITKLATALVFLEHNPGWDSRYEVKAGDIVTGGRIYLSVGERVHTVDLFNLALVASANSAAKALARSTGLSEEEFIALMNAKAEEIGLTATHFVDPVGLGNDNVSTPRELAKLVEYALNVPEIEKATKQKTYQFKTLSGQTRIVATTDNLLGHFPLGSISIEGGKTGYTESAGYCLAGKFENADGREVVTVVLGTDDINARFEDTTKLVEWVYDSYIW